MERQRSLSMNNELDLILRSCSNRALFLSKSCKNINILRITTTIFICKIGFSHRNNQKEALQFYLVSHFCFVKFPVKKFNTLLQLTDLKCTIVIEIMCMRNVLYLLTKSVVRRISAKLHIRSVRPGLQSLENVMLPVVNTFSIDLTLSEQPSGGCPQL